MRVLLTLSKSYISYRQSYAHHPAKKARYGGPSFNAYSDNAGESEERRGLMSAEPFSDNDAVIEMDVLPPRWLDKQDEVADLLTSISKKTTQLDSLHSKHVLPGFDDEDVKKREEREIERLTQDITKSYQQCQKAIRRVESMAKEARSHSDGGNAEETMARNLMISLATKVGDSSAVFRKKQANYLKKLRALSGMGSPADGASTPSQGNPYLDPSMMESDADRSLGQSTIQQAQTQKKRQGNDTLIAQREKEIEDIAQGIIDLANIFQELQTMVIDQGTMLDRIDYNVERMTSDVKAADQELNVATGYQKKSTKRKIILLLILIIAGVIILLFLKPRRRAEEPPPPLPPPDTVAPAPPPPGRRRTVTTLLQVV